MHLMPGDEIEVSFMGAPELNTLQAIRRDGRISLQLIGEVEAGGKTPEELQDELRKRYAQELQIGEVLVIPRLAPPVLVSGSVLNPGKIRLDRPLTVLDAIMESGGFNMREAEVRSVVLIRHEDGLRKGFIFDFKRALAGEGQDRPFYVKPRGSPRIRRAKHLRRPRSGHAGQDRDRRHGTFGFAVGAHGARRVGIADTAR